MSTTTMGNAPTQQEARPTFRRLRRGQVILGVLLLALIVVVVLTAFGPLLWQIIGLGTLLVAFAIVVLIALGVLLITLVIAAIIRKRRRILPWLQRLLRLFLVLGTLLVA